MRPQQRDPTLTNTTHNAAIEALLHERYPAMVLAQVGAAIAKATGAEKEAPELAAIRASWDASMT